MIYEKDFHFLDETILKMEQRREDKRNERLKEREEVKEENDENEINVD